jgi:hypothetical protein
MAGAGEVDGDEPGDDAMADALLTHIVSLHADRWKL